MTAVYAIGFIPSPGSLNRQENLLSKEATIGYRIPRLNLYFFHEDHFVKFTFSLGELYKPILLFHCHSLLPHLTYHINTVINYYELRATNG